MLVRTFTGLIAAATLLVAACGTTDDDGSSAGPNPEPTDQHEPGDDHEDHDESGDEQGEPQPRLAIIDRDSPHVHIVDLLSGDVVDVVELTIDSVVSEGVATTEDGRYLMVGGPQDVDIIDVGTWAMPHGDHFDYYTTDPALVDSVAGPNPTHLISHGGVSALYFDGSGEAVVIDDGALANGEVSVIETIDTGAAHHGFAVPVDGGYVVTWPHGEDVLMPDHVAVLDDSHEILSEHVCLQTHGEAGFAGGVAAACEDGILVLHAHGDHWDADLLAYPDVDDADPYGFGAARSWLVEAADGVDWGLAVLGTQHLLRVDFEAAEAEAYDLGEAIAIRGVGIHGATESAVVLTQDGSLQLFDLDAASVQAQVELIDAFVVGDPDVPSRTVTVSGDRAWVVDPDANLVVEVDLADSLAETRRWELDFSPATVTVHGDQ